jgi:hypothetical protein
MLQARWNLNLNRFRNKIGEKVKQKAERVTQTLVDGFIEMSPVYRGHFRASWNVSEGVPRFVQAKGGSPEAPLGSPNVRVRATKDFPVFFITNGQPYGKKLEYGSSRQAPNGVVRVTIAGMK